MPLYDQSEVLTIKQTLAPSDYTAATNGSTVAINDNESVTVVFNAGTITDGTHTPTLEYSQDGGSTWTALTNDDLVGTLAAMASDTPQSVGWIGVGNAIRAVTTVAGATSGGVYSATVILGNKGSK